MYDTSIVAMLKNCRFVGTARELVPIDSDTKVTAQIRRRFEYAYCGNIALLHKHRVNVATRISIIIDTASLATLSRNYPLCNASPPFVQSHRNKSITVSITIDNATTHRSRFKWQRGLIASFLEIFTTWTTSLSIVDSRRAAPFAQVTRFDY